MKPVVIDLFCGLGGWTKGFLAEGWDAYGFDLERHVYGDKCYPAQLILQDVLTLHGSQFRDCDMIVASPPCQRYSYMAMPWKRGKAQAQAIREDESGTMLDDLNALFSACFRLQSEASEAAGRHIPMVVENVKGAQPWVGSARAHFGSYYLWGDIEFIGGRIARTGVPVFGETIRPRDAEKFNPDGTKHGQGSWFAIADSTNRGAQKRDGRNFHAFENGLGSSPSFNGGEHETRGVKIGGSGDEYWRKPLEAKRREATAVKCGGAWFGAGNDSSIMRQHSSKSDSRKAASAMIAEIPFDLAQWVAKVFKPTA